MIFNRRSTTPGRDFLQRVVLGLAVAMAANLAVSIAYYTEQVKDRLRQERAERIMASLPKTADFWNVGYVRLDRGADGELVVYTDAHALVDFEGRYKVALRDGETLRHEWTPKWSEWLRYKMSPFGTRYRQPETIQWWADRTERFEPPRRSWVMETCWQARIPVEEIGLVELTPACVLSTLDVSRSEAMEVTQ